MKAIKKAPPAKKKPDKKAIKTNKPAHMRNK